jgi:hypothetical protein
VHVVDKVPRWQGAPMTDARHPGRASPPDEATKGEA